MNYPSWARAVLEHNMGSTFLYISSSNQMIDLSLQFLSFLWIASIRCFRCLMPLIGGNLGGKYFGKTSSNSFTNTCVLGCRGLSISFFLFSTISKEKKSCSYVWRSLNPCFTHFLLMFPSPSWILRIRMLLKGQVQYVSVPCWMSRCVCSHQAQFFYQIAKAYPTIIGMYNNT